MQIQIIPEKCIACGLCQMYAPEVFDYHDSGIVKFLDSEATVADVKDSPQVIKAIQSCPSGALLAH